MEVPSEGQAMKSDYKGKCSGKRSESGQVCKGDMTVTSAARSGIFASDCWPQFCVRNVQVERSQPMQAKSNNNRGCKFTDVSSFPARTCRKNSVFRCHAIFRCSKG